LLKLKAMRGTLTDEELSRWTQITSEFQRRQQMGGDQDTGEKVVRQLVFIAEGLQQLHSTANQHSERQVDQQEMQFGRLADSLSGLQQSQRELTEKRGEQQAELYGKQLRLEQLRLQREQDWQQQQQQHLSSLATQLMDQLQQLDLTPQVHVQIDEPHSISEVLKQMSSLLAQVLGQLGSADDGSNAELAAQTQAIQTAIQTGQSQTVQLLRQLLVHQKPPRRSNSPRTGIACLELFEPWMASLPSTRAFAYFWPVKSEACGRHNHTHAGSISIQYY